MALNYPGPYELRVFYTVTLSGVAIVHQQRMNVKPDVDPTPGVAFAAIDVENSVGAATDLATVLGEWVAILKAIMSAASATIDYAELWKYEPETFQASFVSSQAIAEAGTHAGGAQYAGEEIYMFRTKEGGTMRITLQEATQAVGSPVAYGDLGAVRQALVDYVELVAEGAYFLGRDTSYPLAFTRMFPGQNEAIFKKRFRP